MTRGSRASQIATVSLPVSPGPGATSLTLASSSPASARKRSDFRAGKAEPAMREFLAHLLFSVGREIDDQQPPAGPQRPRRLANAARDRRGNAAPDG